MKRLGQPHQLISCSLQRFKNLETRETGRHDQSPVSVISHSAAFVSMPSSSCTSMEHELRRLHFYSTSEEDAFYGCPSVAEVENLEPNATTDSLALSSKHRKCKAEEMDIKVKLPTSKSYENIKEAASEGAAYPGNTADANTETASSSTESDEQMKQKHSGRNSKRVYPEKAEGPKKRHGSVPTLMKASPFLASAEKYKAVQIDHDTGQKLKSFKDKDHLLRHTHKPNSMKAFPSKWDDADKWLNVNQVHNASGKLSELTDCDDLIDDFSNLGFHEEAIQAQSFMRKDKYAEDPLTASCEHAGKAMVGKDEISVQGYSAFMKDAATEMSPTRSRRDTGTEATPFGSSLTSVCTSPTKNNSPARHNTPARRSLSWSNPPQLDYFDLQRRHLAKLELPSGSRIGSFERRTPNWSSREEEEEDSFKYLRHADIWAAQNKSIEARTAAWEQAERSKCRAKYIREEAKIEAWENHQKAKAEAELKKLEVKLERLRRDATEKIMHKVSMAEKKAEEMRVAARTQQDEQIAKTRERSKHIRKPGHFGAPFGSVCFVPL